MKKLYFLILLSITIGGVFTKVNAQSTDKISLSLGPEYGIPVNTSGSPGKYIRDYYKDGIGGSLKLEVPVFKMLYITVTAGYMHYQAATKYFVDPYMPLNITAYKYVPLKTGLRYYLIKYFYVEGDVGEAVNVSSTDLSSFIYSGGAGGVLPINAHNSFELGASAERGYKNIIFDYPMSQVAFRLAYRYKF